MTAMPQSVAHFSNEMAASASFTTDEQRQHLTFTLGKETFAVGILAIKEILRYGAPTEVPMTHPCLVGVINLRGRVVPVIDLAVRLGREPVHVGRRTCIVIIEVTNCNDSGALEMGLVVDTVRAVVDIPTISVDPPPAFGVRLHPDYMIGVTRQDGLFVVILDLNRILAMEELAALTQSARTKKYE
ncbi:purine-binding chemotaxis protein CheW [Gammaproteobacteria bacterium]